MPRIAPGRLVGRRLVAVQARGNREDLLLAFQLCQDALQAALRHLDPAGQVGDGRRQQRRRAGAILDEASLVLHRLGPALEFFDDLGRLRLNRCGTASTIMPPPMVCTGEGRRTMKWSPGPATTGVLARSCTRYSASPCMRWPESE